MLKHSPNRLYHLYRLLDQGILEDLEVQVDPLALVVQYHLGRLSLLVDLDIPVILEALQFLSHLVIHLSPLVLTNQVLLVLHALLSHHLFRSDHQHHFDQEDQVVL